MTQKVRAIHQKRASNETVWTMRFFCLILVVALGIPPSASAFVVPSASSAVIVNTIKQRPSTTILFAEEKTRRQQNLERLQQEIDQALEERELRRQQLEEEIRTFTQEFERQKQSLQSADAQLTQEAQTFQQQYEQEKKNLEKRLEEETKSFQKKFEAERKSLETADATIVKKLQRLEKAKTTTVSSTSSLEGLLEGAPVAPFAVLTVAGAGLTIIQRRQQQQKEQELEQQRVRAKQQSEPPTAPAVGNAAATVCIMCLCMTYTLLQCNYCFLPTLISFRHLWRVQLVWECWWPPLRAYLTLLHNKVHLS